MEEEKIVITKGFLDERLKAQNIKDNSTFKSIKSMEDPFIDRTIKKSIKKLESSDYLNRKIVGFEVTQDQLENLSIAIEELTIHTLLTSSDEKIAKGYKSEKLSDYSYTLGENAQGQVDIDYLIEDLKYHGPLSKSRTRISVI